MSRQASKSTTKTMGFTSDNQIELWSSDAKVKTRLYQKRFNRSTAHQRINEVPNEEEVRIAVNTSLNRLRDRSREERSNSSSLSNRIAYMQVELQRKKQLVSIAKGKYQRMIEVRNKSMLEKKELSKVRLYITKQRELLLKRHHQSVSMKASRIKLERKNSSINSNMWKSKNLKEAEKVKDTRLSNEKMIAERIEGQSREKKELVRRGHKLSDISREKLRELKERKLEEGKKLHDLKLIQQFAKGEMQRRKNAKLIMFFKQKARQLEEQKLHHSRQLFQYEQHLGKCFKLRTTKSKDSFYMTN